MTSPYLTSAEAVGYLKLPSLGDLYYHIRENKLPFKRIGRSYRFDTRELDAWLDGYDSAIEQKRALRSA